MFLEGEEYEIFYYLNRILDKFLRFMTVIPCFSLRYFSSIPTVLQIIEDIPAWNLKLFHDHGVKVGGMLDK